MHLSLDSEIRTGLRSSAYLPEIECLRGLAVLLVFLFHGWGIASSGAKPGGIVTALLSVGNTGVTLFFVLSGFLLSRPWLQALCRAGRPPPAALAYALARAARILPMYYLMIAVTAIHLGTTSVILPAATFQMLGFEYFPYSVVWWTLVTEMQFYLLLPIVGTLALRGRAFRLLLAFLTAVWLAWYLTQVALAPKPIEGFLATKSVFARLPAFVFGAFAASLTGAAAARRRLTPPVRAALAVTATAALLWLLLRVARMSESAAEVTWPTYHIWEALCWSALVLALASGPSAPWRLPVVNPVTAVLGKLSYSIYLLHVPVLFYAVYPLRESGADERALIVRVAVAGAATLLLAAITYLFVERPFLKLKARLRR